MRVALGGGGGNSRRSSHLRARCQARAQQSRAAERPFPVLQYSDHVRAVGGEPAMDARACLDEHEERRAHVAAEAQVHHAPVEAPRVVRIGEVPHHRVRRVGVPAERGGERAHLLRRRWVAHPVDAIVDAEDGSLRHRETQRAAGADAEGRAVASKGSASFLTVQ